MGAYQRLAIRVSSFSLFAGVALAAAPAFAQGAATDPASPAATPDKPAVTVPIAGDASKPDDADKIKKEKDEPSMKHLAIEANPMGILIGRYSAQLELMPWRHSAFVINPHFDHVSADVTTSAGGNSATYSEGFTGFGTELGYRFYTGKTGMTGFYFGPSVLLGTYTASTSVDSSSSVSFQSIGGALDIGGQAVVGPGIVIGGGFGLQYTAVNKDFADLPLTASILAGGGIRPRFLLSIGYAL